MRMKQQSRRNLLKSLKTKKSESSSLKDDNEGNRSNKNQQSFKPSASYLTVYRNKSKHSQNSFKNAVP